MTRPVSEKIKKILRKIPFFVLTKKLYYFARRTALKLYNAMFPTAIILLYHRVAELENDINFLSVNQKNFENQLIYLSKKFNIISLNELVDDLKANKLKRGSVVVTFDDGYADNLHNALPILKKHKIPATIFVTAGKVGNDSPFFWEENMLEKDRGRCVNHQELKQLSSSSLIEIGAHTVSHPKLSQLSIEKQDKEITESKSVLERLMGIPVRSFAYPFGGKGTFDEDTVNLVAKNGFNYACANIHKRVNKNSSPYTLPRFIVRNWTVEELKIEMEGWL